MFLRHFTEINPIPLTDDMHLTYFFFVPFKQKPLPFVFTPIKLSNDYIFIQYNKARRVLIIIIQPMLNLEFFFYLDPTSHFLVMLIKILIIVDCYQFKSIILCNFP